MMTYPANSITGLSGTLPANSFNQPAVLESEIRGQMDAVNRQLGTLRELIEKLEVRLEPILSVVPTGASAKDGSPQPALAPLADELRTNALTLAIYNERVLGLIGRIAL